MKRKAKAGAKRTAGKTKRRAAKKSTPALRAMNADTAGETPDPSEAPLQPLEDPMPLK